MLRRSRNFSNSPQLSLAGITPPLEPVYPLFFALLPDAFVGSQIVQAAQRIQALNNLHGTLITPECLHVTLHPAYSYSSPQHSVIVKARQAANSLAFPGFDVTFDQVMNFDRNNDRKHPIVLCARTGTERLQEFYRTLGAAMAGVGLRPAGRNYTPHVTLMYSDDRAEEKSIEKIGWSVREFVLVQSLFGQTRDVILARWTLGAERKGLN